MLGHANNEELVLFYAHGNDDAFAELYSRHYKPCYSYFLTCTQDEDEAADLCSALFEKLMKELREEPPEFAPGMFEHWLHHRAHNDAIDWGRTRSRNISKNIPYQQAGQIEDKRKPRPLAVWKVLGRELHKLRQRERIIFILRYFKQKSFAQIAMRLGSDAAHASDFSKAYIRICEKLRKPLKRFL